MDTYSTVVFVCEHGAAKSVVAAALFNRMVIARHLTLRAVARGTVPDEAITPAAAEGMQKDGLTGLTAKPQRLLAADFDDAVRVIAFCPLPLYSLSPSQVEDWSDIPPVSQGYEQSRDAMIVRMESLLDELDKREKRDAVTMA